MQLARLKSQIHDNIRQSQVNELRLRIRQQLLKNNSHGSMNQYSHEIQMNEEQHMAGSTRMISNKMQRIMLILQQQSSHNLLQMLDTEKPIAQITRQANIIPNILTEMTSESVLDINKLMSIIELCNESIEYEELQQITNRCLQIIKKTYFPTLEYCFQDIKEENIEGGSLDMRFLCQIWKKCDVILVGTLVQKYKNGLLTLQQTNFLITFNFQKLILLKKYNLLSNYTLYQKNIEWLHMILLLNYDQNDQQMIYEILLTIHLMILNFPQQYGNPFIQNIIYNHQFISFAQRYTNLLAKTYQMSDVHLYNTITLVQMVQFSLPLLCREQMFGKNQWQNGHEFDWLNILLRIVLKHYYNYEIYEIKQVIAPWIMLMFNDYNALFDKTIILQFYYDLFSKQIDNHSFEIVIIDLFSMLPLQHADIVKQLEIFFQTKYLKCDQSEEDLLVLAAISNRITLFQQKSLNRQS